VAQQWFRACQLIASGAGGTLDLSELRVRFTIKQITVQMPNTAEIRVTNLSKATAARFHNKEFTKVQLIAGYEGNSGIIFSGNIKQTNIGRENPTDTYVDLFCGDGDKAYNFGAISKTLAAGSTPKQVVDALAQGLAPYDVRLGFTPPSMTQIKYPRPVVLFGMVRDHLRQMAFSHQSTWNISNGVLNIVPKDGSLPGGPVMVNAATGMIGMPVQTNEAIVVRVLINPQMKVDTLIQLNNADINPAAPVFTVGGEIMPGVQPDLDADGVYRVLQIETTGDTRGQNWYMDLSCLSKSGAPGINSIGHESSAAMARPALAQE